MQITLRNLIYSEYSGIPPPPPKRASLVAWLIHLHTCHAHFDEIFSTILLTDGGIFNFRLFLTVGHHLLLNIS